MIREVNKSASLKFLTPRIQITSWIFTFIISELEEEDTKEKELKLKESYPIPSLTLSLFSPYLLTFKLLPSEAPTNEKSHLQ